MSMLKKAVRKGQMARSVSKMHDPAHIVTLLRGAAPADRAVAYDSLESSHGRALAVATLAALGKVLRRPELEEAERVRVSLLMQHFGEIDATAELLELLARNQATHARFSLRNLGDAGCLAAVPALDDNSSLTQLDLSCNMIRVDGVSAVAQALHATANSSVALVNLSANFAKDPGAAAFGELLATSSTVTALDLHANQIGNTGAKALARGLAASTVLKTLDLRANDIGDAGAVELIAAARRSPCLTLLNLHCNYLGVRAEAAMQEAAADGWQRMGGPGAVPPCVSCVQPAYLLAGAAAAWSSGESSAVMWRHKDTPQTAKAVLSLKAATVRPPSTGRAPFTPPWDMPNAGPTADGAR